MAKRKKIEKRNPSLSIPHNSTKNTIVTRPRVAAVCKVYNIAEETLFDFLKASGYGILNSNSLLDTQALKFIDQQFQSDKITKDRVRGNTTIDFINPKVDLNNKTSNTQQTKETGSRLYREPVLHLTNDIFNHIKQSIFLKGYKTLVSNFNDDEAINICSKMSSSLARRLCKQIYNPYSNKQLVLYQIHYIANKTLYIFGSKIMTFIYGLRNLNFKNQTADAIQTYKKVIPGFPILSFETNNTSFKISFFAKKNKGDDNLKPDIRLFTYKKFEEIGVIDEEGYIMSKLEKFKPQLTLFYQDMMNRNFEIYSGVETGRCEMCGRVLSHPASLRIGIGPTCASNKDLDIIPS